MKQVSFALVALALVLSSACASIVPTLEAQTLPLAATFAWDASANTDDYVAQMDGVVVGMTVATSIPVTITTLGQHTFTVVARNQWGSSDPASLTVTVSRPGKSANLRIK